MWSTVGGYGIFAKNFIRQIPIDERFQSMREIEGNSSTYWQRQNASKRLRCDKWKAKSKATGKRRLY